MLAFHVMLVLYPGNGTGTRVYPAGTDELIQCRTVIIRINFQISIWTFDQLVSRIEIAFKIQNAKSILRAQCGQRAPSREQPDQT